MEIQHFVYLILGILLFFSSVIFNLLVFKVSLVDAFGLPFMILFISFVFFYVYKSDLLSDMKKERGVSLEVALEGVPYQEIEMEKVKLLTKEEQIKDGVKDESFLFIPKEDGQEMQYIEIAFQEQLKQIIHRFPAYVEYEDVQKAQIRYQLFENDVYNAVVTLPIVESEEAE